MLRSSCCCSLLLLLQAACLGGDAAIMSSSEEDEPGTQGQTALDLLQAHGELFMSMFDDHDSKRKKNQVKAPASRKQAAAGATDRAKPAMNNTVQGQLSNSSRKGTTKQSQVQQGREEEVAGAGKQIKQKQQDGGKRARDDIEEILFAHNSKQKKQTQVVSVSTPTAISATARERKLFMSSKAGKVHETAMVTAQQVMPEEEEDAQLSPQQFKALQMEVERLGASGLDRKERKKWQAAMLQRLGAKADKSPRMPARMGLGIASASKAREARKLEEAIQTGMAKRKGISKSKKLEHERTRDRGLNELGRSFKAGVLRVKNKPKAAAGHAGVNPVRAGAGKGGKKGKHKGSGLRLPF